nr:hypothetical protein [Pseudomonas luteola]
MKKILGILVSAACSTQLAYADGFKKEIDRFTGETTISWISPAVFDTMVPNLFAKPSNSASNNAMLFLSGSSKTWRYLHCNQTYWLVDGRPIKPTFQKHDGKMGGRGVVEYIYNEFSLEQVKSMASASKVEFKICNDEYQFTQEQIDGFKQVVQAAQQ